ncbi:MULTISPECIES: OstA-like protein [Reichenbachiella]|uniref:OstA-like protein n=1 Tax=Reichenbachiella TaxID=156993 RepID=UPI000E6C9C31|nr:MULTISPECIES: OstA-like protein [Reichenbachiella]MBU2914509.1 Organic solvent tolerance protein OstA [Reichenbachiella agariperforans]
MRRIKFLLIVLSVLIGAHQMQAQRKSKIRYKAQKLTNAQEEGEKYKKLIGKVVFTQNETIVYCDSAYFFKDENIMEAYGRVRIKDGDSVTITARKLIYEGDTEMALLREDVVYRRGKKRMYTDFLDYHMTTEVAEFKNDGKLVDEHNTLTSSYGIYYSKTEKAYFYNDVLLVSPDFNLRTDSLEYSSYTKVAISTGPTYIDDREGTTVDSKGGTYRTLREQTTFAKGTIETRNYILVGDDIFIDEFKKFYTAKGNVVMTSKKDDIVIFGDEALYDKEQGISKVYGKPVMKKIMKDQDTLFMSADTLVAIENVDKDKERVLGYYDILIYQDALQGKCDSIAYFLSDSTIHMYRDPILWNENSQMEADSIDLIFKNDLIYQMNLRRQAFLSSLDTMGQHNQIKGREMIGRFDTLGHISTMDVNGNGESHYFVLEGDSLFIGMNKIFCSRMKINFEENNMRNITFYNQPEAQFIPPLELVVSQHFLDGFSWRVNEKPSKNDVLTRTIKDASTPEPEKSSLKDSAKAINDEINKRVSPEQKKEFQDKALQRKPR